MYYGRGDSPCNEDQTNVTITVTDALIPKFDQDMYNATIPERALPNYPVVKVSLVCISK